MGLIIGRVKLTCPKTDKEVDMLKDCFKCEQFKHYGIRGNKIVVTCEAAK